jgi:hypothetical protein
MMTDDIGELIIRARQHDPDAAVALADLVEGALADPGRRVSAAFKIRHKGGEAKSRADRRGLRDEALRELAELTGADLLLEQQAQEILRKTRRYRSAPADPTGSTERRALHRIAASGLPVPGLRQLKRILSGSRN